MLIRKLNWAGALIESRGIRLLVDPIYKSPNLDFFGQPREPFSPLEDISQVDAILVTHLHSDHFDPHYILQQFGPEIKVLVPQGTKKMVMEKGLQNVLELGVDESLQMGELLIIASYSVDGLGDHQVSWIIKDGNHTIIHSGDTLWHGYWWKMEKRYGPFDVALLPVNGAVVSESGQINSEQPLCLNPEQAVSAAKILQAKILIPIHYHSFHNPPYYIETENIKERLLLSAAQNGVEMKFLNNLEGYFYE